MRTRLILLTGFALCMASLFCITEVSAKDEAQPLPQQAIDYILDLESDDFQARQQATKKLPEYGAQIIDPLLKVTQGDSLEAAVRAILVIEQVYIQGKEKSVSRAEDALEQLANAKNPSVAIRAEEAIDRHADIREKRAVREITKMGGKVTFWTAEDIARTPGANTREPGQVRYIVLGEKWWSETEKTTGITATGGDKKAGGGDEQTGGKEKGSEKEGGRERGLRFIKRIRNLDTLYMIKGNTIPEVAMDDLMRALPATRFQTRDSDAMLGISSQAGGNENGGCLVGDVSEGLAAANAGIHSGDLIIKFGEDKVENFNSLVDLIGKKEAGNKVEVLLIRNGKPKSVKVTLSSWLDR
ncbi:PDZ domain-containing protein [Gimesia algae]|uniref:Periplasmic pH-dependent serine endoprotease DegQ n=1 Tax=Gimesia algae TaxID=2527971 RepID=A0A517V6B2_9PLAN|nr:PDZ domain-containing protein [Gimesia algae]QDT88523.1 Periplasmic pH-dependent serine endoprotease DegQ precursor [Gimesia algae]